MKNGRLSSVMWQATLLILRTLSSFSKQVLLTSSITLKPAVLLLGSRQQFPQIAVHCKSTMAWISIAGYLYFIHYCIDETCLRFCDPFFKSSYMTHHDASPRPASTALSLNAVVTKNLPKVPQTKQHPTGNLQFH